MENIKQVNKYPNYQPKCRRCDTPLKWFGTVQNGYYYKCPDCNDVVL